MSDLISREVLRNLLLDSKPDDFQQSDINFLTGDIKVSLKFVLNIIDNAPTVELDESVIQEVLNKRCMTAVANEYLIALHGKRPQGEWIFLSPDDPMKVECPFCHERKCCISNYCDYCGAKMQKEGAENDNN